MNGSSVLRDRWRLATIALLVLILAVAFDRFWPVHALADAAQLGSESPALPVGTEVSFGIAGIRSIGPHIDLLFARIVPVPEGIEVVAVRAARGAGGIGAVNNLRSGAPLPPLYPVSAAHIQPGPSTWYLVATIRVLKPGRFTVSGLDVTYRMGSRTGVQRYPIHLVVNGMAPQPG